MGLVTLWLVGSSPTRDWTCISHTGRWILYHWATRELSFKLCVCECAQLLSHVQLFPTPWTVAHPVLLSMGFSRQEYWLVMPSSIGSSWPRDRTEVSVISCIGSWIVYHWATWKASFNLCTCGIGTNTILMIRRNWGRQSNFPKIIQSPGGPAGMEVGLLDCRAPSP